MATFSAMKFAHRCHTIRLEIDTHCSASILFPFQWNVRLCKQYLWNVICIQWHTNQVRSGSRWISSIFWFRLLTSWSTTYKIERKLWNGFAILKFLSVPMFNESENLHWNNYIIITGRLIGDSPDCKIKFINSAYIFFCHRCNAIEIMYILFFFVIVKYLHNYFH